ncbi:hypothetical protein LJR230_003621 [Trinickia sp. LjRoot230]
MDDIELTTRLCVRMLESVRTGFEPKQARHRILASLEISDG